MLDEHKNRPGNLHPIDEGEFKKYPAPLFEAMSRMNYVIINSTDPYYGPLLYSIIKCISALNVVEIGVGFGYCSWYMAQGVLENMNRFNIPGRYLGIDLIDRAKETFDLMKADGLPVEYIFKNSLEVKPEEYIHQGRAVDVLFQDGNHYIKHCLKELEIIYPILQGAGNGYLVCHDTYAWCEDYRKEVTRLIKAGKYNFEQVSFFQNYGLTIFRKMEGYDDSVDHWPMSDEERKKAEYTYEGWEKIVSSQ